MLNNDKVNSVRETWLFMLPWSLSKVGGVNQVVINLAKQMQQSGCFRPLVLINDWSAKSPVFESVEGIDTVKWRIHPYSAGMTLKERLQYALWMFHFKKRFRLFCLKHNITVVNPHYPNRSAISMGRVVQGLKHNVKMITSFHGADLTQIKTETTGMQSEWRRVLSDNSHIVACSADLAHKLSMAFGPVVSALVRVVHNGVDAQRLLNMSGDAGKSDRKTILNIAKFEHKKGQDLLVEAFSLLAAYHPDVDLVLAGAAGDTLPRLKLLCARYGIEHRVRFMLDVPHAEVIKLYKQSTLFCLPSREEPFGIVLLEAGLFHLPVVASRVGGVPEVIEDGVSGMLVRSGSVEALTLALETVLLNADVSLLMGDALNRRVMTQFTWSNALSLYIDLATQREVKAA